MEGFEDWGRRLLVLPWCLVVEERLSGERDKEMKG